MNFHNELVAEFDRETASTRMTLSAIPDDADFKWKANPKSFSLGRLAGHTAETPGEWAVATLTQDVMAFGAGGKTYEPYVVDNKAAMLERYDKECAEGRAALVALDPARWDDTWKMISGDQTWIEAPRYEVFRTWVLNHMIHHRAQLGVNLRLLNLKVPGVYGPSADEM